MGRDQDALQATEAAITLYRQRGVGNQAGLVAALNNLGVQLGEWDDTRKRYASARKLSVSASAGRRQPPPLIR